VTIDPEVMTGKHSHNEFFFMMNDDTDAVIQIGSGDLSRKDSGLSEHLFDMYKNANENYQDKMNSISEILNKPNLGPEDMLKVKLQLNDLKGKTVVAIKATEKAMETFNQLLRMQ
jgi:hypothetical protein